MGEALAATIVDGVPEGGRRYVNGRLEKLAPGADARMLTLPDGSTATSGAVPSGDLVAARRATGAPDVVAGSSMIPTGLAVRALLPVVGAVLSIDALRG